LPFTGSTDCKVLEKGWISLHCLGYDAMYFSKQVQKFKKNQLPLSFTLQMKAVGYSKMLVPMY